LRAYAKVNYALEVRGLREDGYHELSTVLQSVSLHDELLVERAETGFDLLVEPEGEDLGPLGSNTIFRAWEALAGRVGEELPVRVRVVKGVPHGAGLGGGSADAAATLFALDRLFGLGLGGYALREVGLLVGADVPFCLAGGTALAEGIGERLSPLPAPPPHGIVVAKPEASAETARIYRAYDDASGAGMVGTGRGSVARVADALRAGDLAALAGGLGNDLTSVTEGLVPGVGELREELLRLGALGASMTGTGTAVFGVFGPGGEARRAALRLEAPVVAICEPARCGVEEVA
jgi:4-diphosphocytidyl-2-C-methyl-D-erythritol kinase